ncbi:hypothetical protein FQA39_LY15142 [Lamprigera yunnana]|nr:hypothetical protein FQA39_LY15142 [Lamprigera yunnana]
MAIRGKENDNGVYEFPYMVKKSEKTKWETFKSFIWNPNTNEVLGRTGPNWGKILLFYLIFYITLAALFAICMAGLYATLNKDRPKYTNLNSLIGTNPGLGFRPIADRTSEGALIWYNTKNLSTSVKWIQLLDEFLNDYAVIKVDPDKFSPACNFDQAPRNGLACPVNTIDFGPCSPPNYGYNTSSPCIFLKLNKIFDWLPEYINNSEDLQMDMPQELADRIKVASSKNESNRVWVSCEGEYDADKEHLNNTTFEYYPPGGGFPSYYYPFQHKKNAYLSPLVAVHIRNPTGGVLINIECRAWAKNIIYAGGNPEQRKGSVHFEIMRDDI